LLRAPTLRFVPRCDASRAGWGGWWVVEGVAYYYYEAATPAEQALFDDKVFTINEFELLAVQWLVHLCAPVYQGERFVLKSDNMSTVNWLLNPRLRHMPVMPIVDSVHLMTSVHDTTIDWEHVKGLKNPEADAISRRDLEKFIALMCACPDVSHPHPIQVEVPHALRNTGALASALSYRSASRRRARSSNTVPASRPS
jgi:hypothetical protein